MCIADFGIRSPVRDKSGNSPGGCLVTADFHILESHVPATADQLSEEARKFALCTFQVTYRMIVSVEVDVESSVPVKRCPLFGLHVDVFFHLEAHGDIGFQQTAHAFQVVQRA